MRYVIREKFFRLGEDSVITDDQGQPVLEVDGKVLSLRNRLVIRDMRGTELLNVYRRLVAIRPTYDITASGGTIATVRKKLISFFIDRFIVDIVGGPSITIKGSLFDHEYTFVANGQPIATVSKRWFSITDTYGVDIRDDQEPTLILACVLALDLVSDREQRERRD